jgi:hypothetical protein
MNARAQRDGLVVTFYSYKGGVGRSLAVANVATLLALWGYRVLCVDWDLEAPGLDRYFKERVTARRPGLLEFLTAAAVRRGKPKWRQFVSPVRLPRGKRGLHLISAGRQDTTYAARLQRIDWNKLYADGFGEFLETVREEWKRQYDFVLLDSRTGVTDIGGICTIQLPDVLALLFTGNEQSLGGVVRIANQALEARNKIAVDRAGLRVLPIPSRFETRVEHNLSRGWTERFIDDLSEFYASWAHRAVLPAALLALTKVPYVPYWSFGEKLPVLEEGTTEPGSIGYTFATVAALLAHRLANTDLLVSSRDEFVAESAQGVGRLNRHYIYDAYLAYDMRDIDLATRLAGTLQRAGLKVLDPGRIAVRQSERAEDIRNGVRHARHLVAIVGSEGDLGISSELRLFLSDMATDRNSPRRLCLVVRKGVDTSKLPPFLERFARVPESSTDRVLRVLTGGDIKRARSETAWKGSVVADGRKLTVVVTRSENPSWYELAFEVSSTTKDRPLRGEVTFNLHETFAEPSPTVAVQGGKARVTVLSYGAFVAQAVADRGKTQLLLDLAKIPGVPRGFKDV